MAVQDRMRSTGTVYSLTQTSDGFGGIANQEVSLIASYRFWVYPKSPRNAELIRKEFGLEPNIRILYGTGQYDSSIASNQILVDDSTGDRYKILSVDPQYSIGDADPKHVALVVMKQQRSSSEG